MLFFAFMGVTIRLLHRVRKRTPDSAWYFYRSLAVEVALIGTMTAAFFSSRLYGESIYWLCGLAFALHRLQSTELEGVAKAVPAAAPENVVDVMARPAFGRQFRMRA